MAAKEAADYALKGEVKATSKDGYAIGTFAGGCFWCVDGSIDDGDVWKCTPPLTPTPPYTMDCAGAWSWPTSACRA